MPRGHFGEWRATRPRHRVEVDVRCRVLERSPTPQREIGSGTIAGRALEAQDDGQRGDPDRERTEMTSRTTDLSSIADMAQRAGEAIVAKGGRGRELMRLGSRLASTVNVIGKRSDSQQIRALMDELISAAKARLEQIVQTLVTQTGASRADAESAAALTPLGGQLIELRDAAIGLRMSAERTGGELDGSAAAKSLRNLQKRLRMLDPTDAVIDATCRVDATLEKVRSGGEVSADWLEKVKHEASILIDGKDSRMTKQNTKPTPLDVLEKAERDQFGNVKDPNEVLSAMREAAPHRAAVAKSGSASERLDALAKSRAEKDGIDFYDAYDRVCGEEPELLAEAVAE